VRRNELGQPIGDPVPNWTARPRPPRTAMQGRLCRVEPVDPERHAPDLFEANSADRQGRMWTYLGCGPFATLADYRGWLDPMAARKDPFLHAIVDQASGRALGVAAFMRIDPAMGVIEVGHIALSPALQGTTAATEAMWLMMRRVFDELEYRRYEWKCDALNAPSRKAAQRLGFSFEGIFRQAMVYKGRNRDTAWHSIVDDEWPRLDAAFQRWLAAANFDDQGRQRERLYDLTAS
jgi:RimJ/RimL family protein N-acetyltransferase